MGLLEDMAVRVMQRLIRRWQYLVFRERNTDVTPRVRALRLLEEVLELCQADEISETDIFIVLRQVYDKEPGHPISELGGVIICAVAYAETRGWDLEDIFWTEFERIMDPVIMEKVRRRNLEGDKIGMKP